MGHQGVVMAGPWMKFYPTDWRADPALRMCSVGARGLWMEILCLMHEAEPYGSLRINGNEVTPRQIASLVGTSPSDVEAWLSELETAGVFSRDDVGVIISRRMQRDKAKSESDRANGKRGGNPGLKERVNPPVKCEDKAQKPEARDQISDTSHPKRERERSEFEQWYQHYPHKVQRGAAERAFAKARKLSSLEELIAGLQRYVRSKPEDRHWQNPATWLNGKGWLDDPAPVHRATAPPGRRQNAVEALASLRSRERQNEPSGPIIDHGDAEFIRPVEPRLRGLLGDTGQALRWPERSGDH